MVSAGVSWNGKTDIHFIDTNNTKVNTDCYVKLLDEGLLPDCRRLYPSDDFIFQLDGAPSHTSRITQGHLEECTPVFIKKDEWPPQSGLQSNGLCHMVPSQGRRLKRQGRKVY